MNLDVKFAKVIMAFAQQDPNVSDKDALAWVKYNLFSIKTLDGTEVVSVQDVEEMINKLGQETEKEFVTVDTSIKVGDPVKVLTDDAEVEGNVKEIKYIISGLGNKHYAEKDITKI